MEIQFGCAICSFEAKVLCVLGFCKSAMDWDLGVGGGLRQRTFTS